MLRRRPMTTQGGTSLYRSTSVCFAVVCRFLRWMCVWSSSLNTPQMCQFQCLSSTSSCRKRGVLRKALHDGKKPAVGQPVEQMQRPGDKMGHRCMINIYQVSQFRLPILLLEYSTTKHFLRVKKVRDPGHTKNILELERKISLGVDVKVLPTRYWAIGINDRSIT